MGGGQVGYVPGPTILISFKNEETVEDQFHHGVLQDCGVQGDVIGQSDPLYMSRHKYLPFFFLMWF